MIDFGENLYPTRRHTVIDIKSSVWDLGGADVRPRDEDGMDGMNGSILEEEEVNDWLTLWNYFHCWPDVQGMEWMEKNETNESIPNCWRSNWLLKSLWNYFNCWVNLDLSRTHPGIRLGWTEKIYRLWRHGHTCI